LQAFWDRLRRGGKTRSGGFGSDNAQDHYPLGKSQVLEMLALRSSGIPVIGGEKWREICAFYDRLDSGANRRAFEKPNGVHAELKEYQKLGVQRLYDLYRLGLGSILADDMGLGKTLQTLTFLAKLLDEGRLGPVLLVVPTSLTYNWLSENKKFTPDLPMRMFSPKAKDPAAANVPGILLTTYGLLQ
jgi:SNF2 family DNA or RNA helicase